MEVRACSISEDTKHSVLLYCTVNKNDVHNFGAASAIKHEIEN